MSDVWHPPEYNHPLSVIARKLSSELDPGLHEGGYFVFTDEKRPGVKYPIKVTSGCYLDATYGRVSNWWTWHKVGPDGSLGRSISGYGGAWKEITRAQAIRMSKAIAKNKGKARQVGYP